VQVRYGWRVDLPSRCRAVQTRNDLSEPRSTLEHSANNVSVFAPIIHFESGGPAGSNPGLMPVTP